MSAVNDKEPDQPPRKREWDMAGRPRKGLTRADLDHAAGISEGLIAIAEAARQRLAEITEEPDDEPIPASTTIN